MWWWCLQMLIDALGMSMSRLPASAFPPGVPSREESLAMQTEAVAGLNLDQLIEHFLRAQSMCLLTLNSSQRQDVMQNACNTPQWKTTAQLLAWVRELFGSRSPQTAGVLSYQLELSENVALHFATIAHQVRTHFLMLLFEHYVVSLTVAVCRQFKSAAKYWSSYSRNHTGSRCTVT